MIDVKQAVYVLIDNIYLSYSYCGLERPVRVGWDFKT